MNLNYRRLLFIAISIVTFTTCYVYADTHETLPWVWLSNNRPWDIAVWLLAIAIVVETLAIWWVPKTGTPKMGMLVRIALTVTAANIVSLLLPYYMFYGADLNMYYTNFQEYIEVGYGYFVGRFYVLLTFLVESPLVAFSLFFCTEKRKTLFITVFASNIATTIIVALIERAYAPLTWLGG